jgi:hypothetical protein
MISEGPPKLTHTAQNPLVERVLAIFDADGDGEIDFQGGAELFFFNTLSRARALMRSLQSLSRALPCLARVVTG